MEREPLRWATCQQDWEYFSTLSKNSSKFSHVQKNIEHEVTIWKELWENHRNGVVVLQPKSADIVVDQYIRLQINVDQMKMLANQAPETHSGPTEDELIFQIDDLII